MPTVIVTMQDDATEADIQAAEEQVIAAGGTIKEEFTIFKGFSAWYPDGNVTTLEASKNVKAVELDGTVTTQ